MTVDREQIRRDASVGNRAAVEPFATYCLALLTELEQAERERDEATKLRDEIVAKWGWLTTKAEREAAVQRGFLNEGKAPTDGGITDKADARESLLNGCLDLSSVLSLRQITPEESERTANLLLQVPALLAELEQVRFHDATLAAQAMVALVQKYEARLVKVPALVEVAQEVEARRRKWSKPGELPFPIATALDKLANTVAAWEQE